VTNLQEVEDALAEIEETLREGGMEGLGYQKQEEQIADVGRGDWISECLHRFPCRGDRPAD